VSSLANKGQTAASIGGRLRASSARQGAVLRRHAIPWHARNSLHRMLTGSVLMLVHSVLSFSLLCQSSMTLRLKEHVARTTSQRPSQSPPSLARSLHAHRSGALKRAIYGTEDAPVVSDVREWWHR
jgi:hypothetical protein